jgi:hypothetical protein
MTREQSKLGDGGASGMFSSIMLAPWAVAVSASMTSVAFI